MIYLIGLVSEILQTLIIVRVLLSWFPHNRFNPLVVQLYKITDVLLRPFQDILPPEKLGGFDISPIFAMIALSIIEKFILSFLI